MASSAEHPASERTPRLCRVAVVGGGLSGLAAAHALQRAVTAGQFHAEITLFEASETPGGVIATRHEGDYLVECGADSFITNKPAAIELCEELGLTDRLIPTAAEFRRSLVLHQGEPVAVPSEFQLLSPAALGPIFRSPLFSWRGKLRMALEYLVPASRESADESVANFVRRRFGSEAFERLIQPLVGGIYTSDPDRLSLQATMPRFVELEREYGSLIRGLRRQAAHNAPKADTETASPAASGARYGLFVTLAGGIGELIEALAERVRQSACLRLQTRVTGIQQPVGRRGYLLQLDSGEQPSFDAVVLAVPAYRAAELLAPLNPELAGQLNRIEYASTALVITGHRLSDVAHPLDAFGLVIPQVEQRQILAVSFASRKFPGRAPDGCVLLRTFVGGALQPELFRLSDDRLLALVREELQALLGVRGEPTMSLVVRWKQSMPQYHVGHLDLVAGIERELQTAPRLALAGNAYRGVGIPDCIASGQAAADRILAGLPQYFRLSPKK